MGLTPDDDGKRYEHVGTLSPTPKPYRGGYQFTNEPKLVHLVEWGDETTLCGLSRDAFDELDPVYQVDEFPSCEECRQFADWRFVEAIISRQAARRTEVLRELNGNDSNTASQHISDLMTRMHEGLNAFRDAIIAGDRDAYLVAQKKWRVVEAELDEVLPLKSEPLL